MNLKISEHLDIQNSYKILRLESSQTLSFIRFSACYKGGSFLAAVVKNSASPSGVNMSLQGGATCRWLEPLAKSSWSRHAKAPL